MSADNYALVGPHPLAGIGDRPKTAYGVIVAFMSADYKPSVIPEFADVFPSRDEAVAFAQSLKTEYGVVFLTDHAEAGPDTQSQNVVSLSDYAVEQLTDLSGDNKLLRDVVNDYAQKIQSIHQAGTDGEYTWKGLLYEFLEEVSELELDE